MNNTANQKKLEKESYNCLSLEKIDYIRDKIKNNIKKT